MRLEMVEYNVVIEIAILIDMRVWYSVSREHYIVTFRSRCNVRESGGRLQSQLISTLVTGDWAQYRRMLTHGWLGRSPRAPSFYPVSRYQGVEGWNLYTSLVPAPPLSLPLALFPRKGRLKRETADRVARFRVRWQDRRIYILRYPQTPFALSRCSRTYLLHFPFWNEKRAFFLPVQLCSHNSDLRKLRAM